MTLKLPRKSPRQPAENTIPMINIVFLMLIFFLIAGSLAPQQDGAIDLITSEDAERSEPPDALGVRADGTFSFRGQETTLDDYLASYEPAAPDAPFRLVVDRALPAVELVGITGELRAAGIAAVTVMTERAAP